MLIDLLPDTNANDAERMLSLPDPAQPGPHTRLAIKWDDTDAIVEYLFGMKTTCVLDVIQPGGMTLEEAGKIFGITRERIRQIEFKALRRPCIRRALIKSLGKDFIEELAGREVLQPMIEPPTGEAKPKQKPRPARNES